MLLNSDKSVVAVFDFDHTLIDRDSFIPFLIYSFGKAKTFLGLLLLTPYFLLFICGLYSRQRVKEKIINYFLAGKSASAIEILGINYAFNKLDDFIKPEALATLKWHQLQGHRCLIVSASLSFYLKPWAEHHQFETVLCSKLAFNELGLVSGKLKGKNCWGFEKKKKIEEYLGSYPYILYAYGDSRGDKEMLQMANHPYFCCFPNI